MKAQRTKTYKNIRAKIIISAIQGSAYLILMGTIIVLIALGMIKEVTFTGGEVMILSVASYVCGISLLMELHSLNRAITEYNTKIEGEGMVYNCKECEFSCWKEDKNGEINGVIGCKKMKKFVNADGVHPKCPLGYNNNKGVKKNENSEY